MPPATPGGPDISRVNLPSGGPADPLATPAVRAKYLPNENVPVQGGLFTGDPAGPFHPGGNAVNRRSPTGERLKNAAIFGVRSPIRSWHRPPSPSPRRGAPVRATSKSR